MQAPKKHDILNKGRKATFQIERTYFRGLERGSYYDEGFGPKHPIWVPPLVDSRLELFAGPTLGAALPAAALGHLWCGGSGL